MEEERPEQPDDGFAYQQGLWEAQRNNFVRMKDDYLERLNLWQRIEELPSAMMGTPPRTTQQDWAVPHQTSSK
jgi:hypothetical protein